MGMSNPKIYVNLLGDWTLLSDEDSIYNENPYTWIKENDLHEYTHLMVGVGNNGYRLHPSHIQIVN